ncbi:Uncharacterised protein [Campylobacter hyointestinalis]|uniref:hypothetical protein n=1 Tax=Campylobacter hyointestinalis TaxID=198 RepID=UPI00072C15B7|nr:hypothetical protein [Campylobacter hyointestinalis]PPB53650.1 hypothetical protein CDQ67_09095 [Campylobacter hyointestinalis subsp. hyointestinalis]CUU89667.1 Uncharacterised protein [Campylobacter hyointestinalis]
MTKVTNIDEFVELINETKDTEFQIKNTKFEILRDGDTVTITDEMGGVYGILSKDDCYLPLFEELEAVSEF